MDTMDPKTILLVEDEAIIAMSEQQELSKFNYNVIAAYSGEKAVKTFEENNECIDLVLMDIDLGFGMDGTEAARHILKRKEVPIVFLSSHEEPEIVNRTEKISYYGYVVKHSSITVLVASIKMALKLFGEKQLVKEQKQQLIAVNEKLTSVNKSLEFAQKELLDKEKKWTTEEGGFKQAQQLAKIGHWHYDLLNDKLQWSDEIFRIFELNPQEHSVSYKTFLERVHPEDREKVDSTYKKSLQTRQPYELVHRIQVASGKIKHVVEKCKTKIDKDGQPIFSIGTVQDITDHIANNFKN